MPVPVSVPDPMCVGRGVCWAVEVEDEVEVEPDCPAESVVEASYCTKVPVVDWKSINRRVDYRQDLGSGLGLFTVL
jgi:hypothetical protein